MTPDRTQKLILAKVHGVAVAQETQGQVLNEMRADVNEMRWHILASRTQKPPRGPPAASPPERLPAFRSPHRKAAVCVGLGGLVGALFTNPDVVHFIIRALGGTLD